MSAGPAALTIVYTVVVIAISAATAVYLGLLDYPFLRNH